MTNAKCWIILLTLMNSTVKKKFTTYLLVALESKPTITPQNLTNSQMLYLLNVFFPIFVRFGFCAMLLSPSGSTCQPRIFIQTKPNSPKSIINGHNYRTYNVDYILHTVYSREYAYIQVLLSYCSSEIQ